MDTLSVFFFSKQRNSFVIQQSMIFTTNKIRIIIIMIQRQDRLRLVQRCSFENLYVVYFEKNATFSFMWNTLLYLFFSCSSVDWSTSSTNSFNVLSSVPTTWS